ncbi:MAG: caspase family protein [Propylenella sp.]
MIRALVRLASASVVAFAVLSGAEADAKRVALIIGNDAYSELPALQKAVADATDVASALRTKGFDSVDLKTDLTRLDMDLAIASFLDSIDQGDTAVFFYSGHGWSDGTQNMLVGTDAPRQASEALLSRISISLQNGANGILDEMTNRGAKLKVAIVDACRDNPFTSTVAGRSIGMSRGLARVDASEGTFVIFSAGAGETALDRLSDGDTNRNSVFTRTFLPYLLDDVWLNDAIKAAQTAVKEIANPHRQSPAYYDQVSGRTCLSETCRSIETAPAKLATSGDACALAEAHYQEAKDIGTRAALEDHVNRFRNCQFAVFAEERIALIDRGPTPEHIETTTPTQANGAQCEELVGEKAVDDIEASAAIAACKEELAARPTDTKLMYLLGRATEAAEDLTGALGHYSTAGKLGYADAQFAAGSLFDRGRGVEENKVEAVNWYRMAAEQGNARAQSALGRAYFYGQGVKEDKAESVKWTQLAAEQGRADAQFNLALNYYRGQGVKQDAAEAAKWFRMSADQGNVKARNNLAIMYFTGDGVKKDDAEAVRWFRLAAGQGDPDANWALGGFYYGGGGGLPRDLKQAAFHFMRALAFESADAKRELIEKKAAGLSSQLRQEIQKALQSEGIYSGAIDGSFGPSTKAALEEYASRT